MPFDEKTAKQTRARQESEGRSPALTHGVDRFKETGELPAGREHIQQALDSFKKGLVDDLGGAEVISTAQALLIEDVIACKAITSLIFEYVNISGAFRADGELQPCLKTLATYMNTARLGLTTLGLERRRKEKNLNTLIKEMSNETEG